MSMSAKEGVFNTIKEIVCNKCPKRDCKNHMARCMSMYASQAEAIYTAHVKPLEDALTKAKEDKSVLVDALEGAESWLEGWESAEPYLFAIRAALARVRSPNDRTTMD